MDDDDIIHEGLKRVLEVDRLVMSSAMPRHRWSRRSASINRRAQPYRARELLQSPVIGPTIAVNYSTWLLATAESTVPVRPMDGIEELV